jgi:replication factor A2
MLSESKPQVQDGDFFVHGIELNLVSFCGIIRNITDNTSNLVVQIEDGTGVIDIRTWINDQSPDENKDVLEVGKYVYVTGSLKDFQGKKNIQHATFSPIEGFNQVIYHQLSAIDVYLKATGKTSKGSKKQESLFVSNPTAGESSGDSISDRIFECIAEHTPSMPEGVPVQFIAQTLNLLVDDVQLHCGKLTEDAKIYVGYHENGYLAV